MSTALQEKEKTIESQIAELKKQIQVAGNVLVKEYVDNGHSGAYLDRPALDELRAALKTDSFDAVYFHSTDRIARDVMHQNIIISELINNKKQIVINGIDYEKNPENEFSLTVLGAVSQFERAKIMERTRRGWLHRLRQGQLVSQGRGTYGYDYMRKTPTSPPALVINEEQAKTVRYIFEQYANNLKGVCAISRSLEQKNIRTCRGKNLWNREILIRMLQNKTYIGTRYFNTRTREKTADGTRKKNWKIVYRDQSEWIAVKVPTIVSQDLFDKAQERIKKSRERYCQPDVIFLLRGLVVCGECGRRYCSCRWYEKRKLQTGELRVVHWAAYRCNSGSSLAQHDISKLKRCRNPRISTHILDDKIMVMIQNIMLDPKKLSLCMERGGHEPDVNAAREIARIARRAKLLDNQRRQIIDNYAHGRIGTEKYIKRNQALDTELNRLTDKKRELTNAVYTQSGFAEKSIQQFCANARMEFVTCNDFDTKRKFLRDHIEKIIFNRDRVTIIGSVPAKNAPENTPLSFRIEDEIDRKAIRSKTGRKNALNWPKKRATWRAVFSETSSKVMETRRKRRAG